MSLSTNSEKRCESCLKYVKIYITCFKCDAAYHIYCWKKVTGAYINQRGQLFCCSSLTSNCTTTDMDLGTQNNPPGRAIEEGNVDEYKDLVNCPIKEEYSEWNEFQCDGCYLEFTNNDHLKNHYSECPNKEGGVIEDLKEDKDLENCLHKEEDLEWSEFRCGACLSEFMNKNDLNNHYSECPNKEGELVQELKEDKDLENHLTKEENSELNEKHLENGCSQSPNKQGGSVPGLNKAGLFCSFCDEENFQKESYEQRIRRCHVESSYSQSNKDNSIWITNTEKNPSQADDKGKKYKRPICNCSTHVKECVVKRTQIHSNENSFKCDVCDYEAKQSETLTSHLSSKHYDRSEKYDSRICAFSTPAEDALERLFKCNTTAQGINLKIHVKSKHSNTREKYKCGDCEYSTYRKEHLIRHMRFHTIKKPFKCDICDHATTWKKSLKIHVLAKHSNADKEYKCRDCEYSAHEKGNLIRHIHTHTNEKPFKCDICDYAAVQKRALEGHILAKHSNADKEYKCRDCQYSSHDKGNLIQHIHTHTNEKPFKCDMCDYAAVRKGTLKRHVLEKHSKANKEYKCRDCAYSTYRKASLIRHINTHINEKLLKCNMCNYAVSQKKRLRRHILAKHF